MPNKVPDGEYLVTKDDEIAELHKQLDLADDQYIKCQQEIERLENKQMYSQQQQHQGIGARLSKGVLTTCFGRSERY